MRWILLLAALFPALGFAQTGREPSPDACDGAGPMSAPRLLRRLSLDLRGHAPSLAELESVVSAGQVPDQLIEEFLRSNALLGPLREHHEALLWPNLEQIEFVPQTHLLFPIPRPSGTVYVSPLRSAFFRTAGSGNLFEPCADEPAQFDAEGRLVMRPVEMGGEVVAYLDGWVEVSPYWAPNTTVRVCALEALDAQVAPACPGDASRYPFLDPICEDTEAFAQSVGLAFRRQDVDCSGPLALFAPGCGCGADLRRCVTPETMERLRTDLNEQALRIVDRVVSGGQPYPEILSAGTIEVSGPIAHFMRHQARLSFDLFADPDPTAPMASVPLEFTSESWLPIDRTGRHAGVLTTPLYLLRHAAWRQRAHRFYHAFECSSFEPAGPLPSPLEPCSQTEDLTQRCGCDGCHRLLEPMAAHWGRFPEFGFMSLDEETFPTQGFSGPCRPPFSNIETVVRCSRLYALNPPAEAERHRGELNAYVFRSSEERQSIAEGPRTLVARSLASGRLDSCTAERMWARFMHRPPTPSERAEVLPALLEDYRQSNRDLRTLIGAIVRHPAYGRAP